MKVYSSRMRWHNTRQEIIRLLVLPISAAARMESTLRQQAACRLWGGCMLHEQGASIAAEAYARISENYGACRVTSDPRRPMQ